MQAPKIMTIRKNLAPLVLAAFFLLPIALAAWETYIESRAIYTIVGGSGGLIVHESLKGGVVKPGQELKDNIWIRNTGEDPIEAMLDFVINITDTDLEDGCTPEPEDCTITLIETDDDQPFETPVLYSFPPGKTGFTVYIYCLEHSCDSELDLLVLIDQA